MSGRRQYHRYSVTNAAGNLKVVRDVTIWRDIEDDFIAIGDEPEPTGELLALEYMVNGTLMTVEVCVIESHPTMVNGSIRHRLRLRMNAAFDEQPITAIRAH
jgi:hypothetical protein